MFGYVKPYVPDLRVRENEMYRALYCGLCRSMGTHIGCSSRFTLSYDFVFLAAVRCVLEECEVSAAGCRCVAHPMRRRPMACDNSALSYSAACAAVLTRAKVRDDISDSRGIKKMSAAMLMPSANRMERRAAATADVPRDEIYAALERLSALEAERCPSLDETAACFGDLLAAVFSFGLEGSKSRIASEIGRGVGKYIYVIDAADDAEKDRKSGGYNPLNISPTSPEALSAAIRLELGGAASAVELLDTSRCPEIGEIIRNIIYEGLPREADRIFSDIGKKSEKKDTEERPAKIRRKAWEKE